VLRIVWVRLESDSQEKCSGEGNTNFLTRNIDYPMDNDAKDSQNACQTELPGPGLAVFSIRKDEKTDNG